MKFENTEEWDLVIDGVECSVRYTRTTVLGRENYGADADGNRGMMITVVDDDFYTNVFVTIGEHAPMPLDQLDPSVAPPSWAELIRGRIERYMEEHDAEVPEEEERGPDIDEFDD